MNSMHRKGTVIALVAALALGLSACGGGGGGNLSNEIRDLKQDLADAQAAQTAAEARATAAEAAKAAADAAQATAEAARAAAEAAQMTAEAERDASNAAAAAAAQAQMDAEAAQAAAEAAQAAAEAAQANAEAAQAAAESAQATAEMERDAANAAATAAAAAQAAAEAERDAANAAQMAAEADRDAANAAAMAAAAAQEAAETAQAAAEAAQAQAEADQTAAEAARDAAVAAQMVAQQAATDAAGAQATAEAQRDAAMAAQTAAEAERDAANSAKDAAEAAKTAADANLAQAQADLTVAQGEVQRLTALLGDETNPQAGSVRAELVAAQTRVTELEDMIGSMTDAADAEGSLYAQLAQAKADAAMYKAMVEQAEEQRVHTERVARGNALSTALSTNRVGTADRSRTQTATATDYLLGGADGTTVLAEGTSTRLPFASTGVTAERTSGGAVTVKVALADTTDDNKFADGSGTAGEQWTSAMLTRSMGEGTTASDEEMMVYTDIGAPTPTLVALEFGSGETFVTIPASRPTDSDATGGGMITPQTAPAAGGPALRYNEDTTFPGMYRGVAGTYTCTTSGGNCVVSTNSDGDVSVEGDLQFKPDDIAAAWDKQDAAYVYFGWWLNKPATASAAHMTEAFSGSVGGNAAAVVGSITGKAKYVGPAVGKYAVKSFTAGVQSDAEAGHFTATATLNADFGDASADGTISGTVDGFNTSGDADSSLWKVTLESTALSTDALFDGNTQVTFGGLTVSGAGRYEGSFYDRAADATDTDHANTVAGTFDAHDPGGTANISGAFGGKRQASN